MMASLLWCRAAPQSIKVRAAAYSVVRAPRGAIALVVQWRRRLVWDCAEIRRRHVELRSKLAKRAGRVDVVEMRP